MFLKRNVSGVDINIELTPEEMYALGREYILKRAMQDYDVFLASWGGVIPNGEQKNIILERFIGDMENMNLQEWQDVMREHFENVTHKTKTALA